VKLIHGPGRKSRKQREPVFPKELTQTGKKSLFLNLSNSRDSIFFVNKIAT
jgi:hypothetical protein